MKSACKLIANFGQKLIDHSRQATLQRLQTNRNGQIDRPTDQQSDRRSIDGWLIAANYFGGSLGESKCPHTRELITDFLR